MPRTDRLEGPEFIAQYARARELQAEHFADEILEISDDGSNDWMDRETASGDVVRVVDHEHIQRSKLRVDSRRWLMAKMAPKKYGDHMQVTGKDGAPLGATQVIIYIPDNGRDPEIVERLNGHEPLPAIAGNAGANGGTKPN